jgi:lipid-binding SYLF domain-containing protein
MKKWLCVIVGLALMVSLSIAVAGDDDQKEVSASDKRAKIDEVAKEALDTILGKSDSASKLYGGSYGYAVFDNLKIAFGISGGGGSGVAVVKDSGARTYMKMGTGGVGLGLGGQKYQVVFFFETEKAFTSFVEKGWKAEAGARAAAGTEGAGVDSSFHDGLAIYQITEAGLMASADISGTKYLKNKKLNGE